jgi:thiol-disulfide isomerase/thioredoxin
MGWNRMGRLVKPLTVFALAGFVVVLGQTAAQQHASTEPAASAASEANDYRSGLPDYGPAPEIQSAAWVNSDSPLHLTGLKGSVVLVEFWTFGCINCIHTLPYVEDWYQKYKEQGLQVIGVHFPEFSYERDIQNIADAVVRLKVSYPIGMDNDGATWRAYDQHYWPTMYLVDKQGHLRYVHIGEGAYDQTERNIQDLLNETFTDEASATAEAISSYLTPERTVTVRGGPGAGESQIGSISLGMAFTILDEQDGWYRIRYNDGDGYVSADGVTVHRES